MVTLTIDGKYVVTDGSELKITKENPRLKTSDSYSLDVVLPMSAPENKAVFGNLNRMDVAKRVATMTAVLIADNRTILDGIAKVTSVTDETVKVQLIGGTAGMGIRSDGNKTYIDKIDYTLPSHTPVVSSEDGVVPGYAGLYTYMPVATTQGNFRNLPKSIKANGWSLTQSGGRMNIPAPQPNLLYVFQYVMGSMGYTIRTNTLPSWTQHIYIASAELSYSFRGALPHWTVQEFIDEFEKFFGCTVVVDETSHIIDILSGNIGNLTSVEYDVVDEYEADITDENEGNGKMSGNVEYDLSGNDHEWDCLAESLKESFETKEYESYYDLSQDFYSMTLAQRRKYFFHCPKGTYICRNEVIFQVDQFGMLKRSESDDSTSLRICPVGMGLKEFTINEHALDINDKVTATVFVPVLDAHNEKSEKSDRTSAVELQNNGTIEGVLFGDDEVPGKEKEKENRMQVMFVDDNVHHIFGKVGNDTTDSLLQMPQAFTDIRLSDDINGLGSVEYERWSFAFRGTEATSYIGQLQAKDYSVIDTAENVFQFLCDGMPDISAIYIFRHKRYLCAKLDITITERGIAPIKTGYFYELL